MDSSMPGFPVHHQLLELAQTHVLWVGDAIQPSHPLSSPYPLSFNLSQHQGVFQWVSSLHQVAKVLEFQLQHQSFQWIFRTDFLSDWLVESPCSPRDSQGSSPTPQLKASLRCPVYRMPFFPNQCFCFNRRGFEAGRSSCIVIQPLPIWLAAIPVLWLQEILHSFSAPTESLKAWMPNLSWESESLISFSCTILSSDTKSNHCLFC